VIDPVKMKEVRRVQTANGPGMVLFRPDGRYAFVPSSFTPELDVVDTKTYQVIARIPQASPFSPNLAVSHDGMEVWFTLKDSGKTQVMSAQPPFGIFATLDTGPITNHVTLVENSNGKFAYVTAGGENTGESFSPWRKSRNWSRRFRPAICRTHLGDRAMELACTLDWRDQDAVIAIDTLANKILATIPIGQQPQALVYVPDAVAKRRRARTIWRHWLMREKPRISLSRRLKTTAARRMQPFR
jgi:DNA-binding beta-propeller fold protein YncE